MAIAASLLLRATLGASRPRAARHHVPWAAPYAHLLVVVRDAKELTDSRTDAIELLPAVSNWLALETVSISSHRLE